MKKIKNKILIIYTGGTIGSTPAKDEGLSPGAHLEGMLREDIDYLEGREIEFGVPKEVMPEFDFIPMKPLLDSSNMNPEDWNKIMWKVQEGLQSDKNYKGVLILHGTDTMAFTASALAFMLRGFHRLEKSIVITGSQIPYYRTRTDARDQLISAMILTAEAKIPEVVLFFNHYAFRGCRATKVDCSGFAAFESPNHPALAQFGVSLNRSNFLNNIWDYSDDYFLQSSYHHTKFYPVSEGKVRIGILKLFPGISEDTVNYYLRKYDGLIIESFGAGNGPQSVQNALDNTNLTKDKVITIISQCPKGTISPSAYQTGLIKDGFVDGRDMTSEAAFTKMYYLFTRFGNKLDEIRERMGKPMAGEMTTDEKNNQLQIRRWRTIDSPFSGATGTTGHSGNISESFSGI